MSGCGPTLPTWAPQQVGSYLGYTGRDPNVVAKAALDPFRKSRRLGPFANAVATWRLPHAAFPLVRCQGSRLLHLRHSHPQRVKSVALRTIDPDENEQSVAGCEPSERL